MEEKLENQQTTSDTSAANPKSGRDIKKIVRWIAAGTFILAFVALLVSCYLLYKKGSDLSQLNDNLNNSLQDYKKANDKPDKLTDAALQPVSSDVVAEPTPAPAQDGSYGGTAVQVNADDPSSATPKYVGGEYAPYWLLTKFALTVPDGTKMIRTTSVSTDGHLLTADDEGSAGCGGEGIYMTVTSTLSVPGNAIRAWGSSASYKRGVGCGGADPLMVAYVKYYPIAKAPQYKYIELVTADCATHDNDYNCVGTGTDKTKWRLYSGIVPANAQVYKAGDPIQAYDITKQLYNRDANGIQFYIDCSNSEHGSFYCSAEDYKNQDYNAALKDSVYIQLRNMILNIHEH